MAYTKQEKIWYSIMLNCEYEWYPDQDMQMCRKTLQKIKKAAVKLL